MKSAHSELAGQTRPQRPQLFSSVRISAHTPLHVAMPLGQELLHVPLEHTRPVGHTLPHAPQLLLSVFVLTQFVPQLRVPVGHVQTPAAQPEGSGHARPQAPQLRGSVPVSTQTPVHDVSVPQRFTHVPAVHVSPVAQTRVQLPQ